MRESTPVNIEIYNTRDRETCEVFTGVPGPLEDAARAVTARLGWIYVPGPDADDHYGLAPGMDASELTAFVAMVKSGDIDEARGLYAIFEHELAVLTPWESPGTVGVAALTAKTQDEVEMLAAIARVADPALREALEVVAQAGFATNTEDADHNETTWAVSAGDDTVIFIGLQQI